MLALGEETNSLLCLFSLAWPMGKGWLTLRQVYNHPGRGEDIPRGKPWPPSFVYQTFETKYAKEKFLRSLMLGEEKSWSPGISHRGTGGRNFISHSSTNYRTDQSQDNDRSRMSKQQLDQNYLLAHISCLLFKSKPHIKPWRQTYGGLLDPFIFYIQSGLVKDFSA